MINSGRDQLEQPQLPPKITGGYSKCEAVENSPALAIKIIFWLLLGVLSVIFAEVTCASSPYPFFDGWGLLVVMPLYTLHTLFLAGLIFKKKQVSLSILFLAGIIFGLYEALITKVIWNPTWGDTATSLGGVAWLQTSVLVFYWHPWYAFIFPLLFGEALFTNSIEVHNVLPAWLTGKNKMVWVILLAVLCGINQGANGAFYKNILLSTVEALGVFLILSGLWYWVIKNKKYRMRDLLPRSSELIWVGVLLIILYGSSLFLIRPEALPHKILPYAIIGGLYFITISILVKNLQKAHNSNIPPRIHPMNHFIKNISVFVLVYLCSSYVFLQFPSIAGILIILSWSLGIITGVTLFVRAFWSAFRKIN